MREIVRTPRDNGAGRLLAAAVALLAAALTACATGGDAGGAEGPVSNKILVTRSAYKLMNQDGEAAAVFAQDADRAPRAELICERILLGRQLRTLCYTREEMEAGARDHQDTWRELTTYQ